MLHVLCDVTAAAAESHSTVSKFNAASMVAKATSGDTVAAVTSEYVPHYVTNAVWSDIADTWWHHGYLFAKPAIK